MVRDTIKDMDYFDSYIRYEETRKVKFREMLEKVTAEKKEICFYYIASALKNKFIAQYSRGDSKTDVLKTFAEYLEYITETKIDSYAEYVNILSWIVLFDYGKEQLKRIKVSSGIEDGLTQGLQSYIENKVIMLEKDFLVFPTEYQIFYDYLFNRTDLQSFTQFLKTSWYSSCKDMYWYDSHKSDENVYAGYWCWIGAALIKIRCDKMQPNLNYFPYDIL